MHIRQLSGADVTAYRALHRFGMIEAPLGFVDVPDTDVLRPDAEVAAMLERGEGWGAFEGERLVGKLTVNALPYPSLAHTFWLNVVYIHPDARGSGASSALIGAAMESARKQGGSRLALWVNGANKHARALYERLGFVQTGRIPEGISVDGERVDDVLMVLSLD